MKARNSVWMKLGAVVAAVCCALFAWLAPAPQGVAAQAEAVDVTNRLTIEDRDWAASGDDHTALGVLLDGEYMGAAAELRKYWNDNGATLTPLNNGCDLMEYIHVNGRSAREIVMENKANKTYVGTSFPFSAGSWYAPVTVESSSSGSGGLWIKVMKAFAGTQYTITLKKGFTLLHQNGDVLTTSGDVVFAYNNGAIQRSVQQFSLSFAGDGVSVAPMAVTAGDVLTSLPAVPQKAGYTGVWQIDGQTVNTNTQYSYGEDKTAVAVYTAISYTITLQRANGTVESIPFTMDNAESVLQTVQLTANNEDYAYSWQEELPSVLEAKDYVFVELATDVRPKSKIVSQSVTIAANFTLNFYVTVVEGDSPTMQFVMAGETQIVDGVVVEEASRKYVYRLENIPAYAVATDVEVTLFSGEKMVDRMTYSVERYLNALAAQEISPQLRTLIADVVAYAQAAEAFLEAGDGAQTIEGTQATEYEELYETDFRQSASREAGVSMTAQYVAAGEDNRMTVRFVASSLEGLTIEINGVAASFTEVEEGSGVYEWQSDALFLSACGNRFKIVLKRGETVVQTTIYSVKSYVQEQQSSANEEKANYWKALFNLVGSLTAYAEGE